MSNTDTIALDRGLLAMLGAKAAALGRPRDELVAEVLRRWLEGGRLRAILESNGPTATLSDAEAMELAIAELADYRAERAAGSGK